MVTVEDAVQLVKLAQVVPMSATAAAEVAALLREMKQQLIACGRLTSSIQALGERVLGAQVVA